VEFKSFLGGRRGPRCEVEFTMKARIRYSLRLVFLGVTIAAVLLALWSNSAKRQRQTVAEIRSLGGSVAYDHGLFSVHPGEACASRPGRRKIYVREELRRREEAGPNGATWKEGRGWGRLVFLF